MLRLFARRRRPDRLACQPGRRPGGRLLPRLTVPRTYYRPYVVRRCWPRGTRRRLWARRTPRPGARRRRRTSGRRCRGSSRSSRPERRHLRGRRRHRPLQPAHPLRRAGHGGEDAGGRAARAVGKRPQRRQHGRRHPHRPDHPAAQGLPGSRAGLQPLRRQRAAPCRSADRPPPRGTTAETPPPATEFVIRPKLYGWPSASANIRMPACA